MLLDKILNPRWKHKNPQVRKRALQSLDPLKEENQKIFLEVLKNDPELFIRRIAIQKLTNVGQLQELRESENQSELIEEATNRLCKLLATVDKQHPVSFLKNKLSNVSENRILEYIALHANDSELQLLAIEKVVNETVLIEVLNSTESGINKKRALEKLSSINSLKKAIKILKRKDNEMAALAQTMLDRAEEEAKRSTELQKEAKRTSNEILELINLCKFSKEWIKYEPRFCQLQDRYNELFAKLKLRHLEGQISQSREVQEAFKVFEQQLEDAKQLERHSSGRDAESSVKEETWSVQLDELESYQQDLQQLLEQVLKTDALQADSVIEDYRKRGANIRQKCSEIYSTLASNDLSDNRVTELNDLKTELNLQQQKVENQLLDLASAAEYLSIVKPLNTEAKKLLEKDEDFEINGAHRLLKKYRANKAPENTFISASLNETQGLIARLEQKKDEAEATLDSMRDEFETLIAKLDQALADGKAKTVKPLINRGRNILKKLPKHYISTLDKKGLPNKFQNQLRQADLLLGWQQWSSSTVKEKLVDSMQQLAATVQQNADNQDFDFSAAAEAINKAREQWKQASAGTHAQDDALWAKFDEACNSAYQPCQQFFSKQSEERGRNLQSREAVCQDLEKYVDSVSTQAADEVDWKATEKIIQVARRDWGKLGSVNRKEREKINKRFNSVLNQLEKLTRKRRDENRDRKQQLIDRIEVLLKQLQEKTVELDDVINAVKKVQLQWKEIGPAKNDKQLWEAFRAVCDSVFELRQQEQAQFKQEQVAIEEQREAILQNIHRCAELGGEELLQARAEIDKLRSDWQQLPALKKSHKQQRRFSEACDGFAKRIRRYHDEQLSKTKQLIQQNVASCYRLETLINDYFEARIESAVLEQELSSIEQQWNAVGEKTLNFSEAIDRRFNDLKNMISEIVAGQGVEVEQQIQDRQDVNIKNKEDLCIKLEILANKESPEVSKQRRLEIQVAQLADNMKQNTSPDITSALQQLLSQWHTSGFIPAPDSSKFERRFYSALESLDKDYQYPD